jgi:hypothetical protein
MTTTESVAMSNYDPISELDGAPFGRRFSRAAVLSKAPAVEPQALEDTSENALLAAIDDAGAVLIEDCTPDDFLHITDAVGREFLVHPSRLREATTVHPSIQTVEYGNLALQLHCEMGYLPIAFRPGLACFFCYEPPTDGGATTLADGRTFAQRLAPSSRRLFETEPLRFQHRIPVAMWEVSEQGLSGSRSFAAAEGERFRVQRQESDGAEVVLVEYVTSAFFARPSAGHQGAEPAFINSILALTDPVHFDGTTVLTLESGRPIPEEVLSELRTIADEIAVPVRWNKGDLVIVDNFRMLHGRTAFTGSRAVWARFGDDKRSHPRDAR